MARNGYGRIGMIHGVALHQASRAVQTWGVISHTLDLVECGLTADGLKASRKEGIRGIVMIGTKDMANVARQ